MPAAPSITLNDVGLTWPDGTVALTGITGTFTNGRTGFVGDNGAGKSTLLRIVAGLLAPTTGHVTTNGDVAYLPQDLTLATGATVADLLGIREKVTTLHAIESADVAVEHFDVPGDDWDIETRADDALRSIAPGAADLDRRIDQISGGEAMLVAIAGLRLRRSPIKLLDEPTRSAKTGRKNKENKRAAPIVMGAWARSAHVTAGKQRGIVDDVVREARAAVDDAASRVRDDEHIQVDLPTRTSRAPDGSPSSAAATGHS